MGVMSGMQVMGPTTFVTDRKLTYFGANFLNMFKKKIRSKVCKFTIDFDSWSHEQYISYQPL